MYKFGQRVAHSQDMYGNELVYSWINMWVGPNMWQTISPN